ncbi:MAG: NAD(P)-dependent alcohol dehydrogenase [Thioalkalivibrio sp.]|nr:NAD(P)-dependent alcohol dehydrogenase [Thioalkalivibrio sp.]
MRAVIWTAYGSPDVLHLGEVPKPEPSDGEVLIAVHATTVSTGDCEARSLRVAGWIRPALRVYVGLDRPRRVVVLGQDVSGHVESVGRGVTSLRPGDEVYAATGLRMGAHADYVCLPVRGSVARKPVGTTFEDAAALPVGGLEAVRFLHRSAIEPGMSVLILGAGGSIGSLAVQLARHHGAEVTGVDAFDKLATLRDLGANHVIDYTKEDFTRTSDRYDVIFDVVGTSRYARSIRALKPHGRLLLANPHLSQLVRAPWTSLRGTKRVAFGSPSEGADDLATLAELVEAGVLRAVVDRCYGLGDVVRASRYVETGRKRGSVVIVVRDDSGRLVEGPVGRNLA